MTLHPINNVCALGTGNMGVGTAMMFAMYGRNVILYGRSESKLAASLTGMQRYLGFLAEHALIQPNDIPAILRRVQTTTSLEEAGRNADFVIESLFEDFDLKREKLGALHTICPRHTVFATNTSSLPLTELAETLPPERAERFLATHFFNPPDLMRLIELVPAQQTDSAVVDQVETLLQGMDKEVISLNSEAPAFIVNRVQIAILLAATDLFEQGIDARVIDRVVAGTLGCRWRGDAPLYNEDLSAIPYRAHVEVYIEYRIQTAVKAAIDNIIYDLGLTSFEGVDRAIRHSLGLRLHVTGPLSSALLGGVDIFAAIEHNVYGHHGWQGMHNPSLLQRAVAGGATKEKAHAFLQETLGYRDEELGILRVQRKNALVASLKEQLPYGFNLTAAGRGAGPLPSQRVPQAICAL